MTSPLDTDVAPPDHGPMPSRHDRPHASTTFTTLGPSAMLVAYDPSQGGLGYISPVSFLNVQSALASSGAISSANPVTSGDSFLIYPPGGGNAQLTTVGAALGSVTAPSIVLTAPGTVASNTPYPVTGTLAGYAKPPSLIVLVDGLAVPPTGGAPTTTTFSLTMPGLASGSHTLQVHDGNGVSSSVVSFAVSSPVTPPETATVATPAGPVTVGQALTVTGTIANGVNLYLCLSSNGHDEGTRVPAIISGSNWTASLTPSAPGLTYVCAYMVPTGGSPLVLSNGFNVAAAPVVYADGFDAPGIYGPGTIYSNANEGYTLILGNYFARGLNGPVTWSQSWPGGTGAGWGINPGYLGTNEVRGYGPGPATQTGTISATDGVTTFSRSITLVINTNVPTIPQGFVLDTVATASGTEIVGQSGSFNNPTYVSADGSTQYVPQNSDIETTGAVAGHYGVHNASITQNGNTVPLQFWFITELPPVCSVSYASQPYTNSPIGLVLATVTASSDAGQCSYAVTSTPANALAATGTGQITVATALPLGSLKATVTVTSPTGRSTTLPLAFNVQGGTILAASNMIAQPGWAVGLDNSMATAGNPGPVPVGSVLVSGMTSPQWTLAVANDECQFLVGNSSTGQLLPRYNLAPDAANPALLHITANHLSAQTDTLVISATQGASLCTASFPVVVSPKSGPNVTVTPGAKATSSVFPTWNAALDAFWTTPATYQGMVLNLPGGVYSQTQTDFSRTVIGHGSNQQWPPGPMTVQGPSPTNRTILDFTYGAKGTGQGGLYAQGGDMVFANLLLRNCTNDGGAEGNAGAIYKTNCLPYNVTLNDCVAYTSDMGFLNGDKGCHLVMNRCTFAECGIGAGGLTHNVYAGHFSSATVTNVLSFATAQVHEFKCRAARSTFTDCVFVDGENGVPGASSCLDFPIGGQHVVTGTVFMKGPNPNNDGGIVQFCEEGAPGNPNGPLWNVNTLAISNCTFLNVAAPGSLTSPVVGVALGVGWSGSPPVSPTTGLPATVSVTGCKFYNIPQSEWWIDSASGSDQISDGGGNTAIYQWPLDILPIDPSTGQTLAVLPGNFAQAMQKNGPQGILVPTGTLQIRIAANAAVGTPVITCSSYDVSGAALASASWSLIGNDSGNFAINANTGGITVAKASVPDSLRWVEVQVQGNDYSGQAQTYTKYLFIVVGYGTLPNAPMTKITNNPQGAPNAAYVISGTLVNYATAPIDLQVYVDGTLVTPTSQSNTATTFSLTMPGLASGTHVLQVYDPVPMVRSLSTATATIATATSATMSAPAAATQGRNLTVTGTANGPVYASLTMGKVEQMPRLPASVTGSTWTVTLTPASNGNAAVGIYAMPTGGNPLAMSPAFTIASPPQPPGPVTGLSVTAHSQSLQLSWALPSTGGPITNITVQGIQNGAPLPPLALAGTVTAATMTGLLPSLAGSLTVTTNGPGGSATSSAASFTTTALPPAPKIVQQAFFGPLSGGQTLSLPNPPTNDVWILLAGEADAGNNADVTITAPSGAQLLVPLYMDQFQQSLVYAWYIPKSSATQRVTFAGLTSRVSVGIFEVSGSAAPTGAAGTGNPNTTTDGTQITPPKAPSNSIQLLVWINTYGNYAAGSNSINASIFASPAQPYNQAIFAQVHAPGNVVTLDMNGNTHAASQCFATLTGTPS